MRPGGSITNIVARALLVGGPLLTICQTRASEGSADHFVCEALMVGAIDHDSDRQLRKAEALMSPSVRARLPPLRLVKFDDLLRYPVLTQIRPSGSVIAFKDYSNRAFQIALKTPLDLAAGDPARTLLHHIRLKREKYDVMRTEDGRDTFFVEWLRDTELDYAKKLSRTSHSAVVIEAVTRNGHSYVAAFNDGASVNDRCDSTNPLLHFNRADQIFPRFRSFSNCRSKPEVAPVARPSWASLARRGTPSVLSLPFTNTKILQMRLVDLPYRLPEFPGASVAMGYVDPVQTVIPWQKESGHAPFVLYVEGYRYVLSFPDEASRARFRDLKIYPEFDKVEVVGDPGRKFSAILTPAEFDRLESATEIRGLMNVDRFTESSWPEIRRLDWAYSRGSRDGVRYYFDVRGRAVALRNGRRYFVVKAPDVNLTRNAAAHAEILRLQRGSALSPRRLLDAANAEDFGYRLARAELNRVESFVDAVLSRPSNEKLARNLNESATALRNSLEHLAYYLRLRRSALRLVAADDGGGIADDVAAELNEYCHGPAGQRTQMHHRFVWLRDAPLDAGLLLSRRGRTIHHQILGLALGRAMEELLGTKIRVRGGLLRIDYVDGKISGAEIEDAGLLMLSAAGATPVAMSPTERQILETHLVTTCREMMRPKSTAW